MTTCHLTFITPLFSKGSYDDLPEIRPPSIRGQLHWWFRALGGQAADEKAVFGGLQNGPAASKVVVRVSNVNGGKKEWNTLPHKQRAQASPKTAYAPGTTCDLHFSYRLGGLSARLQESFDRALEAWLLLGTLGLRGTRGAGSFVWTGERPTPPASLADYRERCAALLHSAPLRYHIIDQPFGTAEEAREVASDTIGGREDPHGEGSLARINHPLGRVFGGRKTSPLRFRIIQIGQSYHIAAVWDGRQVVTGNRDTDLPAVIKLLSAADKRIGSLLEGKF